ncbi:MAG: glycosyltransferase, partial [Bacteroidales bacterium]|nr:glycosyltransferase [Bacteroidales bacterium]
NIKQANILSISNNDHNYYVKKNYKSHYIPAFHQFESVNSLPGKGEYILYHGNLSVNENMQALLYLVKNVFCKIKFPVVVAGSNISKKLSLLLSKQPSIKLINNPGESDLNALIRNAHINILPTFQPTGIKLKLINALFQGRYCLVNKQMVANTGLENICMVKNSAEEMIDEINRLFGQSFSEEEINKRKNILENNFSNKKNAESLINLIFNN